MLLVLHRSDLRKASENKPFDEIDVIDIRGSLKPVYQAYMIIFYDFKVDSIKVMKNRFGDNFTQFSEK